MNNVYFLPSVLSPPFSLPYSISLEHRFKLSLRLTLPATSPLKKRLHLLHNRLRPTAAPHQLSAIHKNEIITACSNQLRIVADDEHGFACTGKACDASRNFPHVCVVKAAGRLVKNKKVFVGGNRACDGKTLLLSAR